MSDVGVIVLMPIKDAVVVTTGSVEIKADCGHQCLISPESLDFHLDKAMETVTRCMKCAGIANKEDLIRVSQGRTRVVPGQGEVLAEIFGREKLDEIYRELGIQEDL